MTIQRHKCDRRKRIARLAKPDPKPRMYRDNDPRTWHQSFGEKGATIGQLLKRLVNELDAGKSPDDTVSITAGDVCHRIHSMCDSFWTLTLGIGECKPLDSVWDNLHTLEQLVKHQKRFTKAQVIEHLSHLLERAGATVPPPRNMENE